MQEVKSTCCYCGVGCGVVVQTHDGAIVGVRGDEEHPANFGRLCSKGSTLHLSTGLATRALHPEMRTSRNTAARTRCSWDEALDFCAQRFAEIIRRDGADAVAFYVSGQLLTEDYYVFNKLAKGLVGSNNIDTNSRLCMSSAVAGYKATLGMDAPPACYEDIDHTQCLFIAGSNTAFAHPILYRRIEAARQKNPQLKTIVVDPRRTDTAREANLHLPILPGTDVALYNGMLHVLLWEELCDQAYIAAHTEGFDALKQTVREYTPAAVAHTCGVPADAIVEAARWFGQSEATLSLYCQGLNQSSNGTQNNAALINLHLATGQIGRPGAGPLSLTGQPNAMGGREVGGLANLLSAHRDMADPVHRAEVARLWGVPDVPAKPGKTAVELFEAVRSGEIKAVWIACTNPAQSLPDVGLVHEALHKAEFVVVQEAFTNTDTVAFADVLLPASTWGEKEGVVTNSERRITRVKGAVAPPGEARADWEIARDFALRLGGALGNALAPRMFDYADTEAVFNEHRESTRSRDLDITGLSYALLETRGPQQWPFPEGATAGKVRLYDDGVYPTPTGRARFLNTKYKATAEKTDARFPMHLNTGRLRDQWHGMSRTGRVARLYNHAGEPVLSVNPADMERRQLRDGDIVRVTSRRGETVLRVAASDEMRPGQTFLPMHWGGQFMNSAGANGLTLGALDPVSKQPELKHAAVRVEKLNLPWQLVVMRVVDMRDASADTVSGKAAQWLASANPLLGEFVYATIGLFGREHPAVILQAAHAAPVAPELVAEIDRLFDFDERASLTYVDAKRGISKRVMIEDGVVTGVRLTGETAARDWLKDIMAQGSPADAVRRWVLAPLAAPPAGSRQRGRVICTCLDVAEQEITERIALGADLGALQTSLKCGTQCGSCVPELKRLVALGDNKPGNLAAARP
ncbi:MAG TPA: molybdopterin-dependent oxidoreductase [Burkholderiales bacterium]|nr:molybdopterin-dependent oxidoreductase [Burkholderiales bacterium]